MRRGLRAASRRRFATCGETGADPHPESDARVPCSDRDRWVIRGLAALPLVEGWPGPSRMVLHRSDMGDAPAYEPPRSDTERQLAEIWQESIGIDSVSRNDDFFLMCGSSLVA